MDSAHDVIARLGLTPHPEGGWYRETWRAPAAEGERASATSIHFLLEDGQRSHWHRVDAAELWFWHAGAPLTLEIAQDEAGPIERIRLGPQVLAGDKPQGLVPAGWWQAARALGDWSLVSCVVSPGFDFAGFELAPEGWSPRSGTD
ncbi:cupin domain-containing protein [Novosphingobium aquimarinum]|uniref:cupin domain-containing protein n=1 Tax=Novosphingobium aquimarinum TaxID=2682494 RepID=UPI0012EB0ABC|nr:cupin domain-containing protein [Novosphingobium aquimarinum]